MEENDVKEGVSIGDIFRTIFSQKWLALILAVAITIVGTICLYFYGRLKDTYSVTFVLQLPETGDVSATSYTYPDGESFYFTNIISYENLNAVAGRDGYEKVDVDKMLANGDISIARALDEVSTELTGVEVYDLVYTISVKASYFSSKDSARDFIIALANIPGEYIASMEINYDRNLTTSKTAVTYDLQLDLLKNQMQYLQTKYGEFITAYGREFIVEDGRTLAQCKDEIDSYLTEDIFATLKSVAMENSYIKDGESNSAEKAKYESDRYEKNLELEVAENTLNQLIEIQKNSGSIIFGEQILAQTEKVEKLKQEIKILSDFIAAYSNTDKIANAEFEARINEVDAAVTKFTDGIKPVASYLYGKVTRVNYLNSSIIEVQTGMGLMMSAVISLVVAIIVAAIAAYIVGWSKSKKHVKQVNEITVFPEAQAQAAVTEDEQEKE